MRILNSSSIFSFAIIFNLFPSSPVMADGLSDLMNQIHNQYTTDHSIGMSERDFINVDQHVGGGSFRFGANLYLRGGIDAKVNASRLAQTRVAALPKAGMKVKLFGLTVPLVEARYAVGNFKTTNLNQDPPPGAGVFDIRGKWMLYVFGVHVQDRHVHVKSVNFPINNYSNTLVNFYLHISGPLGVRVRAGTFFTKRIALDFEARSAPINFNGRVNLHQSSSMADFSTALQGNLSHLLSTYSNTVVEAATQTRSIAAVGRAIAAPINEQFKFGIAAGPQVAVGVWAEASAEVNAIFMGISIGIRCTLTALAGKLQALISTSNVSQYVDLITRGTITALKGKIEAFGRMWGGFRVCGFWGCWGVTWTIAQGTVSLFDFPGFTFEKDLLLARLNTHNLNFTWCLGSSSPICKPIYVVDPVPELDDYFFQCPNQYREKAFYSKIFDPVTATLVCNYQGTIMPFTCYTGGSVSIFQYPSSSPFSSPPRFCQQTESFELPALQSSSEGGVRIPPIVQTRLLRVRLGMNPVCPNVLSMPSYLRWDSTTGKPECVYQGLVSYSQCVSLGGTTNTTLYTGPQRCNLPLNPQVSQLVFLDLDCPSTFLGKPLGEAVINGNTSCRYVGEIPASMCTAPNIIGSEGYCRGAWSPTQGSVSIFSSGFSVEQWVKLQE